MKVVEAKDAPDVIVGNFNIFDTVVAPPFRPDPIGESEPDPRCSNTNLSVATPKPGPTRLADPDQNLGDARPKPSIKYISLK